MRSPSRRPSPRLIRVGEHLFALVQIEKERAEGQLKELESHAILVKREIPNTVPTGIKYILTNKGIDLVPILDSLCNWGKLYADGKKITVYENQQV